MLLLPHTPVASSCSQQALRESDIAEDIRLAILVLEVDVVHGGSIVVRYGRCGGNVRNSRLHAGDLEEPSRGLKTAPHLLKCCWEWQDDLVAGQRGQYEEG